jgi:hypothetical protein
MTTKLMELQQVRAKLAAKQAERIDTVEAHDAPEEIAAGARKHFETIAADRAGMLRRALAAGEFDSLFRVPARPGSVEITAALLGVLSVDDLMERMQPHIAGLPAGLTAKQRRVKLAAIDAELTRLENAEMDLIEQLERDGVAFTLRADMSPAVFLRISQP